MTTKFEAILTINPNIILSQNGDEFIIHNNEEMPSNAEIEAKIAELQAEYQANQYQRDRLLEYPSIQECIHAILDNDLESLQAKRAEVKAKYPKPQ
jgi:predicted house-cleaning noncanonical NTP pyrophosphatase (MazG superfamily)